MVMRVDKLEILKLIFAFSFFVFMLYYSTVAIKYAIMAQKCNLTCVEPVFEDGYFSCKRYECSEKVLQEAIENGNI